MMFRRIFNRSGLAILLIVFVVSLGFGSKAIAVTQNQAKVIHVIERLSFGITPGQIDQVSSQGIDKYIQSQLSPTSVSRSLQLNKHLATSDFRNAKPLDLYKQFHEYNQEIRQLEKRNEAGSEGRLAQLKEKRNHFKSKLTRQAQEDHLMYAIASENQLQEVMVNFWFNHFNVLANKKFIPFWISDYENQIRKNSLGKFRDLLAATARHPAMLVYLDNQLNTAPKSPGAKRNSKGLNENYARELMELHTLGVNGGYIQKDVRTLAKILTGWGVDPLSEDKASNGFRFFPERHDLSDKVLLGQSIKGSGIDEVEQALDILANHPSTASFISYKLAQYFVADEPPQSLVKKLTQKFTASDGDIKAVLASLFASPEFLDPQYYDRKFKTPDHFLISILRAIDVKSPNLRRVENMLNSLSMPTYGKGSPDGYPNTQDFWLNPDALLRRIELVLGIGQGNLNNKQAVDLVQLEQTIGATLSENTRSKVAQNPAKLRPALILGSPEMMYR